MTTINKIIIVQADWGCSPLWGWGEEGEVPDNIEPESLPISGALCAAILAWDRSFQATYRSDDPLRSGFANAHLWAEYYAEGRNICERLARELGSGWEVHFKRFNDDDVLITEVFLA